jgi:hypothetical protein
MAPNMQQYHQNIHANHNNIQFIAIHHGLFLMRDSQQSPSFVITVVSVKKEE